MITKPVRFFIGNLSYDVSARELRDLFTGEDCVVVSTEIATDHRTGKPLGRGWAEIALHSGATVAAMIAKLDRLVVRGRAIHVDLSTPRGKSPLRDAGTRLFAENLPYAFREEDLRWLFEGNGARVASVEISRVNHTGESKGFGWVVLDPDDDAKAVIAQTDGKIVRTRRIRVSLSTPTPLRNTDRERAQV